MSRTGSAGASSTPRAGRSRGRTCPGRADGTAAVRTGGGARRGVRSRSAGGCGSTSPQDESMRISHEAIYQALYVQGRGALSRELTACLRTGRALRVPQARTRRRGKHFVTPEVMISQRPAEAKDRAIPGHWEGDLILGLDSSAIGTLVERTTRFTMLLHLPRMAGHGQATPGQGRAAVGRSRRRSSPRRHRRPDRDPARPAAPVPDLGPRRRDGPARPAQDRHRDGGLLLRPQQPLAAGHQREHQRPAAPVLPQGHRPGPYTAATTSKPSPPPSTPDHARPSNGRPPPKPSPST